MILRKSALFATALFWGAHGWLLGFRPGSKHRQRISSGTRTRPLFAVEETDGIVLSGADTHIKEAWQSFLNRFQGDFDNYNQVLEDRRLGMDPREGGGHENFHCTLIPVSETSRLAAFFFDGNPDRIFRFRYYSLNCTGVDSFLTKKSDDNSFPGFAVMKLHTLNPELELLLRQHSENPLSWPKLFSSFGERNELEEKVDYLQGCDVVWSIEMDPIQHAYILDSDEADQNGGLHAVMVEGEAILDSTMIPGVKIRIRDQLSLYKDVFYINDRGFNVDTGGFIYGNQRGVPYRLERVARILDGKREVLNEDLEWTLGPQWRNEDTYQLKIDAIGGPSARMSRKPPES